MGSPSASTYGITMTSHFTFLCLNFLIWETEIKIIFTPHQNVLKAKYGSQMKTANNSGQYLSAITRHDMNKTLVYTSINMSQQKTQDYQSALSNTS